jgi:hypothetical protein
VARKDRERARKRHAIERARKEAGLEPRPKNEEPSPNGRPAARPRPQRGQGQGFKKMQIGDVDRRGRVFERNAVLHQRTAFILSMAVIPIALIGLFVKGLQWMSYLVFTVGVLVFADAQPTRRRAVLWAGLAAACLANACVLFVYQVL